jgi:2-polyprenyl-3-methyl-5-hydroxy-6-metoxy-1,4-benzoquinol methylase
VGRFDDDERHVFGGMVDESQEVVGAWQFERFLFDIVLFFELVSHIINFQMYRSIVFTPSQHINGAILHRTLRRKGIRRQEPVPCPKHFPQVLNSRPHIEYILAISTHILDA